MSSAQFVPQPAPATPLSLEEYHALVSDDAKKAAKRSLRSRFGRLSNRRIVSVLRPASQGIPELRSFTDAQMLDEWFAEFTRFRLELQKQS